MKRLSFAVSACVAASATVLAGILTGTLLAVPVQGQDLGGPPMPVPGLQRNDVAPLEARGDSLLLGPCLNLTSDAGEAFETLVGNAQLCGDSPNGVLSLDADGEGIVAGLGRPAPGGVTAAAGFFFSSNGGASFSYADPQLDAGTQAETVVRYGISVLPALPVVVPEESAPFAVDYADATGAVWVAGRASGLRRSTDGAETFERIVLPPDSLDAISPDQSYSFTLRPRRGNGPGQLNHIVSSVLVDATGTVWAGTSAGVNRSRPADVFVFEDVATGEQFAERAWRRFGIGNTAPDSSGGTTGAGLSGNFVTLLREQLQVGPRSTIWMATVPTELQGETRALTYTRDGGDTFYQTLPGERVNDLAFRGDTVYVASERGLFVASGAGRPSAGATTYDWQLVTDFSGADVPEATIAKRPRILSVATPAGALCAGTEDGLLCSTDGGATWSIARARVPTAPDTPTAAVPEVETYAYPNPFSPTAAPAGVVRIVAETQDGGGQASVEVYDFAMDFVRELSGACDGDGRCEVPWDGTDAGGARVANGVYFYEIEAGGESHRGRIMVLE